MPPRAATVSLDEIASHFGVTTETIRLWRKEGMPTRIQRGRPCFVIRECFRWRMERVQEAARNQGGPSIHSEQARKLRLEADLAEVKLQELRGQLTDNAVMEEAFERAASGFAQVARGQLQRFERDIIRASTPVEARQITDRMTEALMEGARAFADDLEADGASDDPEVTEAA